MRQKLNSTTFIIVAIALCTSAALMAFASSQRHAASVTVPAVAFYVAAAFICLGSEVYVRLRSRSCRNKTPNLG
jgi:predicted membrane channel-forming protein YqfA (hemolysin III family)